MANSRGKQTTQREKSVEQSERVEAAKGLQRGDEVLGHGEGIENPEERDSKIGDLQSGGEMHVLSCGCSRAAKARQKKKTTTKRRVHAFMQKHRGFRFENG
eukprot:TRINITY_DN1441_c0_g1_i1.p1 TRINITY_DN1441_c0_g1~~TRINITY_DN1441_c0_g1_i1.p1  ORF type:complete len:101 (-),score=0.38 TRINITY_DN1441_c0_g1_i1:28-330(-)